LKRVLFILGLLADTDVEWLVGAGQKRTLPEGERLVTEGVALDSLFIVLDGLLGVIIQKDGKPLEVDSIGAGEVVGEVSLLDSRPPTATVICKESAVVLQVSHLALQAKFDTDEGFAARFFRALAVFLAHRFRHRVSGLGYTGSQELDEKTRSPDEIDVSVLDNVVLAGARFRWMLDRLKNT
jgi:CRP-like cAMP-binding protein